MSLIIFLFFLLITSTAAKPHHIRFKSPNLYPEGLAYDPAAQHFLVSSLRHRTIQSVSDAAVVDTLIFDPDLPPKSTILGLAVDTINNRLLAAVHSFQPLPIFNALAAYDLRTHRRIFLTILTDPDSQSTETRHVANAVAVDFNGNAYVTNSLGNQDGNFIWKVNLDGESTVFSRSKLFNYYHVDRNAPYSYSGLNGVAYISKGYLLVVQSNTGKMFKVDIDDGTARPVLLNKDLTDADGIAVRGDGVVLIVSHKKLWFLKSDDSWSEGVVFDETALDEDGFATSVVVGREGRGYVLYGSVMEGILGNKEGEREWFEIVEVRSKRENEEENVWMYVLIGLGFAYFLFWRFQMKQLIQNWDKKTE